jgi:repressor LexA
MQTALTEKQKKVLGFIRRTIAAGNQAPTIREIAARFGFSSTGTVRDYLHSLSRKGFLKLGRNRARAIELAQYLTAIPILGRVAAGSPQIAVEDIEGYVDLRALAADHEDVFALRVKGDSMKDAGILHGDVVVVRRHAQPRERDIVVALLGDEATVKILRKSGAGYVLKPANKKYKPIPCPASTVVIGTVICVVRTYV